MAASAAAILATAPIAVVAATALAPVAYADDSASSGSPPNNAPDDSQDDSKDESPEDDAEDEAEDDETAEDQEPDEAPTDQEPTDDESADEDPAGEDPEAEDPAGEEPEDEAPQDDSSSSDDTPLPDDTPASDNTPTAGTAPTTAATADVESPPQAQRVFVLDKPEAVTLDAATASVERGATTTVPVAVTEQTTSAIESITAATGPVDTLVTVTQTAFTTTTKVIATVLLPLLSWVPEDVPASQSPLLAVLGWVRREFEYIALGLKPTARPNQMLQDDDNSNVILGTLVAQGANSDPETNRVPLRFELVDAPDNGVVEFDKTGNYLYTPNADSPGGVDTFTVRVVDDGFHLDNLVGVDGHSTLVTVTVDDTASASPTDSESAASLTDSESTEPMMMATSTSGKNFHVYNLSQYDVALVYVGTADPGSSFDDVDPSLYGARYATGEAAELSVDAEDETVYAVFKTLENDQVYHVALYNGYDEGFAYDQVACSASGNGASCTPNWEKVSNTYDTYEKMTDGDTVILLDAPGTTVTIPASETEEQNETLDNLCDDDNVTCDWDVSSQSSYLSEGAYPKGFSPVHNTDTRASSTTYNETAEVSNTYSWEVSNAVTVELEDVAEDEITTTYGQATTDTTSYSQEVTLVIPAGDTGYIYFQAPMYDYEGDWVITGGNTTWYVEDTHVYVPNADGAGLWTTSLSDVPPPSTLTTD